MQQAAFDQLRDFVELLYPGVPLREPPEKGERQQPLYDTPKPTILLHEPVAPVAQNEAGALYTVQFDILAETRTQGRYLAGIVTRYLLEHQTADPIPFSRATLAFFDEDDYMRVSVQMLMRHEPIYSLA